MGKVNGIMKKSDLKTGMIVKTRNNFVYLVVRGMDALNFGYQDIVFLRNDGFNVGDVYTDNLECYTVEEFTIDSIYTTEIACMMNLDLKECTLIWSRGW